MSFSKAIRQKVYEKYNGRCAYCGRKIDYKDMQIDHFVAKRAYIGKEGTDDFSNLMPSCRMCNHYKRANPLELFRRYIYEIPFKLRENYNYKVGLAYGNIIENKKSIEFYFEKVTTGNTPKIVDHLLSHGVEIPVRCGECIYNETGACNLSEFNNPQYDENYYCRDGERKDLNSSEKSNSWKDRVMNTFLGRET